MENEILKALSIVFLLSLPALGQEKIMVCKDVESVFTDREDLVGGSQLNRFQGPPGKKGIQGLQGPPGLPGVQGHRGIPGVVDYEKISEMIEEKIRQSSFCSVGAGYSGTIHDSSFSASTEHSSDHAAPLARLNTPGKSGTAKAWCPNSLTIGQWIQVDLGNKTTVVGVMIQGRGDYDQWVTSFHVACGLTTSSMRKITDENGTIKLFTGTKDRDTVVTHFFHYEECRYLRIYPQTWSGYMCMRMDFIKNC